MDRPLPGGRWTRRRIVVACGACLLAAAIALMVVDGLGRSGLAVDAERVVVASVRVGAFQDFIPVTATVIPTGTHFLDVAEGGTVDQIHAEAGEFVAVGDPILRLANTDLLMDVMQREAEISERSNALRTTRLSMARTGLEIRRQRLDLAHQISRQRRIVDRNADLAREELVAREEVIEAEEELVYLEGKLRLTLEAQERDSLFQQVQIEQLEASLVQMEANLEVVQANLENLVVKAPVSGHLTSLNAQIGELKRRGERLGQIDILEGFKARAWIDEYYVGRIMSGLQGRGAVSGDSFSVVVAKVYPEVREGRFEVDMAFAGKDPAGIRRGQTLHLRVELGESTEAILLPTGGFYQETGGRWTYVVDETETLARKRPVQLGRRNAEYYEVLSGLAPGERVITSSYAHFGEADKLVLQ